MTASTAAVPQFLVIDFNADSRHLLVRTLLRKYPLAKIHESDDADTSVALTRSRALSAIVTHRTFDLSGADLVKRLRETHPGVPIVMVSAIDREAEALAAGANAFLSYEEWLRVGSVVEQVIAHAGKATTAKPGVA